MYDDDLTRERDRALMAWAALARMTREAMRDFEQHGVGLPTRCAGCGGNVFRKHGDGEGGDPFGLQCTACGRQLLDAQA
jgi:hypothetical protein